MAAGPGAPVRRLRARVCGGGAGLRGGQAPVGGAARARLLQGLQGLQVRAGERRGCRCAEAASSSPFGFLVLKTFSPSAEGSPFSHVSHTTLLPKWSLSKDVRSPPRLLSSENQRASVGERPEDALAVFYFHLES